jgi:hypothetical protein
VQVAKHANDLYHRAKSDPTLPFAELVTSIFKPFRDPTLSQMCIDSKIEKRFFEAVTMFGVDWERISGYLNINSTLIVKAYGKVTCSKYANQPFQF